jgi:hypothetical protein
MGSDRLHISFQTVGHVDSFRETNGAAVHDIRHTAFDQFVSTIQEDLLIHKKVFYLNHLLEKCVPFLPEDMHKVTQRIGFN